ncbi:type IV pilin protein [Variovorax sp. EL159]|uniref:type IV pilin protein n=1 Tax=Variovorax sp. EL159 TaxID=1566270 RepID=UPI000AF958CB|nr:type IV pilin protein [Variovorax sp. EL159]
MKTLQRPMDNRRNGAGFTLIEMMIVVAVVAILAAIAYPAYLSHVQKARRTDAKTALLDLATRQERFFSINNTYAGTAAQLGYPGTFPIDVQTSGTVFYQLSVTASTPAALATGFAATATPVNLQANDTLCGTYSIDQLGTQGSTGTLGPTGCW